MKRTLRKIVWAALVGLLCLAGYGAPAGAGGFEIAQQGASAAGTGSAGAARSTQRRPCG